MGDVKIIDLDDPTFAAEGFPGGVVPPAPDAEEDEAVQEDGEASQEKSESEKEKGNKAFRAGDYDQAVEHWSRSVRSCEYILSKGAYADDPLKKAEFLELAKILNLNLAIGEIKRQNFAKALYHCDLVLAEDAENVKALMRKSQALFETHEYRNCVAAADRLLLVEPTNAVVLRLKARAVAAQQQYSAKQSRMARQMMAGLEGDPRTVDLSVSGGSYGEFFTSLWNLATESKTIIAATTVAIISLSAYAVLMRYTSG